MRAQRLHGVHAAPVELDRAADAVGARAEHQHRVLQAARRDVVLGAVVGEVEVVGLRRVLAGERVDLLDARARCRPLRARRAPARRVFPDKLGDLRIREPGAWPRQQLGQVAACALDAHDVRRSRCRNQRSMCDSSWISSTLMPRRSACGDARRCARAVGSRSSLEFVEVHRGRTPATPVSSMRSAFCSASSKLRPIAITSPTDFIARADAGSSAPRNFCRSQRGTLTTT